MIYAVGKHMQVLMETTESMARREVKPRARRKYWLGCTCSERRRENGHCRHTLAIFENEIKPNRRRDVAPQEMSSKNGKTHSERPRIALEREVLMLRAGIEEYLLWRPGERGHAAAHGKLAELLRTAAHSGLDG